MIRVTIGDNLKRETRTVPADTKIRDAFEQVDVDYRNGSPSLDGVHLGEDELDSTFADLGYTGEEGSDRAFLISVVKRDNA